MKVDSCSNQIVNDKSLKLFEEMNVKRGHGTSGGNNWVLCDNCVLGSRTVFELTKGSRPKTCTKLVITLRKTQSESLRTQRSHRTRVTKDGQ